MYYISTRDKENKVTSAQAISTGISSEGGLFVPESFPKVGFAEIAKMKNMSYMEIAKKILALYLKDFTVEEIEKCVNAAYDHDGFDCEEKTPISKLYPGIYVLELWHGPTCAFKDMALQILPHLMTASAEKTEVKNDIVILVATSGDTGKAALEGFKDVPGTKMVVFYPVDGVSNMQKLQMLTQEGANVEVVAINGNFDHAQSGVKEIFTSNEIKEKLLESGMQFSSANSINWGRLLPQIVYYFAAYINLLKTGQITLGQEINVVVPTGNFGNILAAYYAKNMGLPINKLICASNKNNVLTDFFNTGKYDKNREFHPTNSPSMDIIISSNLERLIFDVLKRDDNALKAMMNELAENGSYTLSPEQKQTINKHFYGGFADEEETLSAISNVFEKYSYLCDTHTAVAIKVYEDYVKDTGDKTKSVIVSTASPYKFPVSVLSALGENENDDFKAAEILCEKSTLPMPKSLIELAGKEVRFNKTIDSSEMCNTVLDILSI